MLFTPSSKPGLSASLLGVGDPIKFEQPFNGDVSDTSLLEGDIHDPDEPKRAKSYIRTIILVIITAIVFVTAISLYDVLRNFINNYFAKKSLENPESQNTEQDIIRTEVANRNNLLASLLFASITLLLAIVLIPLLVLLAQGM